MPTNRSTSQRCSYTVQAAVEMQLWSSSAIRKFRRTHSSVRTDGRNFESNLSEFTVNKFCIETQIYVVMLCKCDKICKNQEKNHV